MRNGKCSLWPNSGLERISFSCYKPRMGLTIHWTLSTPRELSDAVVKELAARTKAFVQSGRNSTLFANSSEVPSFAKTSKSLTALPMVMPS